MATLCRTIRDSNSPCPGENAQNFSSTIVHSFPMKFRKKLPHKSKTPVIRRALESAEPSLLDRKLPRAWTPPFWEEMEEVLPEVNDFWIEPEDREI